MSTKFFTWTKGDRSHAAEVLRSADVGANSVDFMSFKTRGSQKTPKSKSITDSPASRHDTPKSATHFRETIAPSTLLTIASNHLINAPRTATLAPNPGEASLHPPTGRPRSRTAPSTPIPEVFSTEPFELPGSTPALLPETRTPAVETPPTLHARHATVGHAVDRTKTAADSKPEAVPPSRTSLDDSSKRWSSQAASYKHRKSESLRSIGLVSATSVPTPLLPMTNLSTPCVPPSLMSTPQPGHAKGFADAFAVSRTMYQATPQVDRSSQDDVEVALMQQISSMRISHDVHLTSLKTAHDKEVASHLSYISFLEGRLSSTCHCPQPGLQKHNLTIDTNRASTLPSELPAPDVSARSTQSTESLQSQQHVVQDAGMEVQELRRKLSKVQKEQAESADLCRQRDQFKDTLEQRDRRILQLKKIVKTAKENERMFRNSIGNLTASLEAANNQRLDALEGFDRVSSALTAMRKRFGSSTEAAPKPDSDPTFVLMDNLKARLKEKEALIIKYEQAHRQQEQQNRMRGDVDAHNAARLHDLQTALEHSRAARAKAETDRDRYNSLLHTELRRQTRQATKPLQGLTPALTEEATARLHAVVNATSSEESLVSPGPTRLEKELEQCFTDIILYKLDIKTYRRDVKRLNAELEEMRATASKRPPTPEAEITANSKDNDAVSPEGGLGIYVPETPKTPKTPTKRVGLATKESLLSASAPALIEICSPVPRSKTPLSTHKKLPRPPSSRTPSPLPNKTPVMGRILDTQNVLSSKSPMTSKSPMSGKSPMPVKSPLPSQSPKPVAAPAVVVHRAETLRSLSDSIISSYTARTSPMQQEINIEA